jgi:hypothetical protein
VGCGCVCAGPNSSLAWERAASSCPLFTSCEGDLAAHLGVVVVLPATWPSLLDLPLLGMPPPRRLVCVTVYSGPNCSRFALFVEIVATVSDEGPGMTIRHHVGPEVAAIGVAYREGAAGVVESPSFAGDMAVSDKGAQVFGGGLSRGPVIGTMVLPGKRRGRAAVAGRGVDVRGEFGSLPKGMPVRSGGGDGRARGGLSRAGTRAAELGNANCAAVLLLSKRPSTVRPWPAPNSRALQGSGRPPGRWPAGWPRSA